MPFAFYFIPALDPADAQERLNQFVRAHRTLAVERRLITEGERIGWCVCVEYLDGDAGAGKSSGKFESKVDYRKALDEATFAVFANLRDQRNRLAAAEKVAPYVIVNNAQLAELARRKPQTLAELDAIEGLAVGRKDKYGDLLLKMVADAVGQAGAPPQPDAGE